MTAITLSLSYSQRIIELLWSGLKNTLRSIALGIILARQTQANTYIVKELMKSGEYKKGHTESSLLYELNQKTLQRLKDEWDVK
jgi:hypothetical protein